MGNLNFLKLFYGLMLVMVSTAFVSCVDDNDDTEAPYLEVSPTTLTFGTNGQPANGSQASFDISTNRSWKATIKDDKSWVTLSKDKGEGSATIQVSIPEGINDEASVVIEISNKVGVLMSQTVTIKSGDLAPTAVIYNETFGTKGAASSPYPFVDQYTDWVKSGEGSGTVEYTGVAASLRQSGSLSAGYEGASGGTKLFFGANSNFVVNKISLKENQTNLKLTFGGVYYDFNTKDNVFKPEKFHFYLSADGETWSNAVEYTIKDAADNWVLATSNFTLKEATTTLYIKFVADVASVFAIDDPTLATGQGGTIIDLGGGGEEPGGEAKVITIPELNAMMTTTQTPVDKTADRYFEAVVQNDTTGNNYSFNNLILATENATTAGNGITLFGSQVEPTLIKVSKGDKVKVTLYKELAKTVNYNGMFEVTGGKTDTWAKVEKIGTATISPVTITVDKLKDFQGMTVSILEATTTTAGIWANADNISSHTLTAGGTSFVVFCKKDATAFLNQPYSAAKGTITGLAAVNSNNGQLVPRNLADVAAFNSSAPTIVSADPVSWSFPATGGTKDIEISITNMGSNTLSHSGLSGILSATIAGTKVTVSANVNTTTAAINQTLKVSLTNGNSIDIPITVAAPSTGGGYSLISTLNSLTSGKYFMAGYVETNVDKVDLTPYNYQLWADGVSYTGTGTTANSDLITVSYQFENSALTPKEVSKVGTEIDLIEVAGKANTYYIKIGDKYLYNSVAATNRRLYLKDTTEGAEWLFMDKSNGTGVTASNNNTYLITASAASNYIRSYKTETQTTTGLFFFKKN